MKKFFAILLLTALLAACTPRVVPQVITQAPATLPVATETVAVTVQPTQKPVVTSAPITSAVEPTQSPDSDFAGTISDQAFDGGLVGALSEHNYDALLPMMADPFLLAGWRSEGRELTPAAALEEMRQGIFAQGSDLVIQPNVDTTALLEGADPLSFFGENAVRDFYVSALGKDLNDEAIFVVGRDPTTGKIAWLGALVASGGFHPVGGSTVSAINKFSGELSSVFTQRNFDALQAMTDGQFSIVTWNSKLTSVSPEAGMQWLRNDLLADGAQPIWWPADDVTLLLDGADPLAQWGPVAHVVRAVHVTGLGASAQKEAIVAISRDQQTGQYRFHGVIVPQADLFNQSAGAVKQVEALDDLNMRSGPGSNYAVEGILYKGKIGTVTGKSDDSLWWRITCPQDASGNCWVSADPELTRPVTAP